MAEPKLTVLSYFGPQERQAILDALARPSAFPVQVGTYGIDKTFAPAAGELPGVVYAPMFPIARSAFWEGRRVSADEAARLPPDKWGGPLPPLATLLAQPGQTRVAWGTELGRRFRDALRHSPQPSWQFDEIVSQVAAERPWRDLIRGVLKGLALGRPRLGDTPSRGIVWMARHAFPLASAPVDGELQRFWTSVEHATSRLAGQEYPEFTGRPADAARALDDGRRALLAGGSIRRALGARYIAGLSPGVELRKGLGGNVDGLSTTALRRWRKAYVAQRAADGVRGVAYFDFRGRNAGEAPAILRELP